MMYRFMLIFLSIICLLMIPVVVSAGGIKFHVIAGVHASSGDPNGGEHAPSAIDTPDGPPNVLSLPILIPAPSGVCLIIIEAPIPNGLDLDLKKEIKRDKSNLNHR